MPAETHVERSPMDRQQVFELISPHPGTDPADVNQPPARIVIPEQQCADKRSAAFGVGPADDDKFLAMQAFDLDPTPQLPGAHRLLRTSLLIGGPLTGYALSALHEAFLAPLCSKGHVAHHRAETPL